MTLTAQQPMNNIVRVAYQAMAAVLGGTQSLHTNSMDETLALPTEESVQVALRTQQLLAYETGVPNVIDPLGGSYYIEALTSQLEDEAESLFAQIEEDRRRGARTRDRMAPAQDRRVGGAAAVGDRAASPRDRRVSTSSSPTSPSSRFHCSRSATPKRSSASDWPVSAPHAISPASRNRSHLCAPRRRRTRT